jgi:hypothetical protein
MCWSDTQTRITLRRKAKILFDEPLTTPSVSEGISRPIRPREFCRILVGGRGRSRMGWSVSRHSEPDRKLDLLDRRLCHLRGAVKRGEGAIHISNAAENVRLAVLALIKAKRALIEEYPQRDPRGRQSQILQEEEQRWLALSIEAIVEEHGKADAQPDAESDPVPPRRFRYRLPGS